MAQKVLIGQSANSSSVSDQESEVEALGLLSASVGRVWHLILIGSLEGGRGFP